MTTDDFQFRPSRMKGMGISNSDMGCNCNVKMRFGAHNISNLLLSRAEKQDSFLGYTEKKTKF